MTNEVDLRHAISLQPPVSPHAEDFARIKEKADPSTAAEFSRLNDVVDDTLAAQGLTVDDLYPRRVGADAVNDDQAARRLMDGAAFVLDGDPAITPLWGREDAVLWTRGEPLMIVGPPGLGKTTLAHQLVDSSIGIGPPELLGLPVTPARRVLYLAMDRPKQIERAMRRLWSEEHRDALADRLYVWKGPLPFDLGSDPNGLLELAESVGADRVVIDSLKDAAVQLTDDRIGGMVNRSLQTLVANGIDVAVLHHQRKGQNGEKPKRLEDVYGSTWLTAGMGSVVLLWGEAGDPIVDLVHLKQPATEVGPMRIEHDHLAGRSSVFGGFDLDRLLRTHPNGVTTMEVARAMTEKTTPTDNERKKAQRILESAVRRGVVAKTDAVIGGAGGATGARYMRTETTVIEAS